MQEDSKIVAVHLTYAANFDLLPFFQEDQPKDLSVLYGQRVENLTHATLTFLIYKFCLGVGPQLRRIETVFRQMRVPGNGAIMFR
jgi:hypothetical protein